MDFSNFLKNYLDFVANDFLVVDVGLGGDLAADHDHAGLGEGLAGDLGAWILGQVGVQNRIRNL